MKNSNSDIEGGDLSSCDEQQSGRKESSGMPVDDDIDQDDDTLKIVYCDRNNTCDIWADLKTNFDECG